MWTAAIVGVEVSADRVTRVTDAVVGPQIYFLVFDAAPQPLDEHVVPPGALAVHADGDAVVGEHSGERRAGELGGFKRSSQHRLCSFMVATRQGPPPAFSIPVPFSVGH